MCAMLYDREIVLTRKERAFKNRISEYILENITYTDPKLFLEGASEFFERETYELLQKHFNIKVHTSFKARFIKTVVSEDGETSQHMIRHFNTKSAVITQSTSLSEFFRGNIIEKTLNKLHEFQLDGSGWAIDSIDSLAITNCKYECFNGSSYIKLPKFIESKKAVINIQNLNDDKCFIWSILAAIHHNEFNNNLNRVSNYQKYENELNMSGITYPVSLQQIDRFESQNVNISVNVYTYEFNYKKSEPEHKIYPVRLTQNIKKIHVHLLLTTATENKSIEGQTSNISDEVNNCIVKNHYCFIKDLSKLLQSVLTVSNRRKKFFCDRCLNYFYRVDKLQNHYAICLEMNFCKITLPSEENKYVEFKNYKNKLEVPFIVYADIEAILQPINSPNGVERKNSQQPAGAYQKHIPHSIAFYFCSTYPNLLQSFYRSYHGSDCMAWFVQELKEIGKNVFPILTGNKPMEFLSAEQRNNFGNANVCHICEKKIDDDDIKCADHSHITGKYRGTSHQQCNLMFQEPRMVPVVFHNLRYDLHLFIEKLASTGNGRIDIIPTNTEDYISFSKTFTKADLDLMNQNEKIDYTESIKFRFIDSFRFLPESLEKLANNLKKVDLKISRSMWANLDEDQFNLIQRKGVYPYDYIRSEEQLNEISLPPIEHFYNQLNETNISQEEYEFAQTVWNAFDVKTLQEYTEIYLKTDVLLLSDIFQNFRTTIMSSYHLDPAHYFTLPGYSWDAMLKTTNAKIELIHGENIDQMIFF